MSGSLRHASNADANAGSPRGSPTDVCAPSSATAAAELFARAAPLIAVPNVTSVGLMEADSIASRRLSTSENRPCFASELRATL